MEEFFLDMKSYVESCIIYSQSDVQCKSVLIHSPIVEEFLQYGVKEVLDCGSTVPIKLAGEVILGA